MPYEVTAPSLALLRSIGEYRDEDGKLIEHQHESVVRMQGAIVEDEDVSPVVKELYAKGDAHVTSVIKRLTPAQAKRKLDASLDDSGDEEVAE